MTITEKQVISRERVTQHGEVLTARREVEAMLDLVKQETERIDSRFLEPACGTGNFLVAILERKLSVLENRMSLYESNIKKCERNSQWKTPFYEPDALMALASIYGIDILPDSIESAKKRLLDVFTKRYVEIVGIEPSTQYLNSAKFILSKNIILGDALNGVDKIIFTSWSLIDRQFKREEYSFEAMQIADAENDLFFNRQIDDSGNEVFISHPVRTWPLIHYLELAANEVEL